MNASKKRFPPYHRAIIELVVAGAIWGLSFTCMHWALQSFSTSTLIFWRFVLAFGIGELLFFIFQKNQFYKTHGDIRLAIVPGICLGLSLMFQTYGLNFTSATHSSFITSLYVVLIPIIGAFFYKQNLRWAHIILSLLAFIGMAFLLNVPNMILSGQDSLELNKGDLLTLICAISSSFHIIYVGKAAKKITSGFRFNNYQSFWSLILIIPFMFFETQSKNISIWPDHVHALAVAGILFLALFVSLIAFYLQIRAQKVLSTTTASMLCLLEAPYAYIFASVLLHETLDIMQFIGVSLIMGTSMISVYIDRPKNG